MRMGTRTVAVCAVVCVHAGTAAAQGRALTLAEVLARAREQAPQVVSARLALEEARGRLLGASVRFQANPEIDGAVGNRNAPDTRFTDFELGIGQSFEPGARRSARIAGANAAIAQGSANIDEVTRTVLRAGGLGLLPRRARQRADPVVHRDRGPCPTRVCDRRSPVQGR